MPVQSVLFFLNLHSEPFLVTVAGLLFCEMLSHTNTIQIVYMNRE